MPRMRKVWHEPARTGWYTPVHIRGVLKTFCIRMTCMTCMGQGRLRQSFRDQLAAAGETDTVPRAIADGFIAAHVTLCQAADALDKTVKRKARAYPVARRLMTMSGVGPSASLDDAGSAMLPSQQPVRLP